MNLGLSYRIQSYSWKSDSKFIYFFFCLLLLLRPFLVVNYLDSFSLDMGFPFSIIKRAPGIVYTWEKNDWARRHGYQMPIDLYLILQWVCLLLLDLGFFGFLVYFTTKSTSETETTLEALLKELPPVFDNSYSDSFSSWSCKISFFVDCMLIFLSCISTSYP